MLGPILIGGNKGQIYFGGLYRRKLYLCLFGCLAQALQGHAVFGKIYARIFFKLVDKPFHYSVVKIVATKVGVAIGRFNLENAFAQLQNANIEGAATKVVDGNDPLFFLVLVVAKGQGSCRRFVNNALYFQAGNFSGVLCSLALGIVKIGGNSNNRFGDRLAQIIFCRFFHFLQYEGRNFLWRI